MKEKYQKLDLKRMYEVTSVAEGHIWAQTNASGVSLIGLICKVKTERPYTTLIAQTPHDGLPAGYTRYVHLVGITFRPLNQKDQRKIEKEFSNGS